MNNLTNENCVYLESQGYVKSDIIENQFCKRCGTNVIQEKNDIPFDSKEKYPYYCIDCDENLDEGEVEYGHLQGNEPDHKYKTVVIDWPFDISLTGKTSTRPNRRKELPYRTMSIEQIKHFELELYAEVGCHVYMWFPNSKMPIFHDILKALNVNFHLICPWVKPSGIAPCFAYKFATEFCVLGFYGKPMQKFIGAGKLNWVKALPERDNHSAKPDEFYELIREMSPEPRIDIFARKRHFGFDAYGDQVEPLQQVLA